MKTKLIVCSILMAVGLFVAVSGMPENNGAAMTAGGLLFGFGLHWYRRALGFKTAVVACLMACAFPLSIAAVTTEQPLLGLIAFVFIGGVYHMVKKVKV